MMLDAEFLTENNIQHTRDAGGRITVCGGLFLRGTGVTALPEGLTVCGDLDLEGTGVTALPEGLTVCGDLDLEGTGITALPEGLTVGGSLDLEGTGIAALPEGLTVGRSLYLEGTGIAALPEGLTVGRSLYLEGTGIVDPVYSRNFNAALKNKKLTRADGIWARILSTNAALKNKKLTRADGIWARILSTKGNVSKVRIFGRKEASFLASSEDGKTHAHGKSAAEALAELALKLSDKGDLSDLRGLPLDTVKTPTDWAFAYRRATGACRLGTETFMAGRVKKDAYTLAEILEATEHAFGGQRFKDVVGGVR